MSQEKKCRVCEKPFDNGSLFRMPGMPGAVQNLPTEKDTAVASGVVLDVRECAFCGLVQLTNDPVPYYKDVIRAGSFSPSMRQRQQDEFARFIDRFSLKGKNILEIGSGRGEYLSILDEMPVNAFGMEHNPELNQISRDKGLKTYEAYPTDLNGPISDRVFDAFVSINFLEHAPDPGAFLRGAANLLTEDGVGMIGVPDFEFELSDNFLFSFMSDHLSYFSSDSLSNTLTLNGFEIVDIFRNQKLNVVTAYFKKREKWDISVPMERFYHFNNEINDYMDEMLEKGGRIALWGASHLAFSIISASKTEEKISYIVDSAPFKQGKYSPASGLEIFPPEHLSQDPVEAVIIMSPEYSGEIVKTIEERFPHDVEHIATFKDGGLEIIQ